MNYKEILDKSVPVTFDTVSVDEDGHEVETMWLTDMIDGKWVEDYVVVTRDAYDIVTDDDGAVFAPIENGRMLVKVPNQIYYRIPEDVYRIAVHVFRECTELKELDVPYGIDEYDLKKALRHSRIKFKIRMWNWPYNWSRSEQLEKEIADGYVDEYGFVYSKDHKRLLKAANVKEYWIPEGGEKIERYAFIHCTFEELNIPYTCNINDLSPDEWPIFGRDGIYGCGCIWEWDKPYSQEDEVDNSMLRTHKTTYTDEYGVTYSENRKRLLSANITFDESEYYVPDGVKTICSFAFVSCKKFLTLSLPSSVKVIGDNLLGKEGGRIIIR